MTKQPIHVKLLIVDDFALDVHAIIRLLKSDTTRDLNHTEFEIHSASTGGEGLILAQEIQPDCILLDYGLPDMDGLEFIDSLTEIRGTLKIPIVMLTGQGDEQVAVKAMKRGVHDYLVKGSFNAGQLTWTIASALEKAKLQKQLLSKHEELELFASRMAHDILGPLSNLSLYAEYLELYTDIESSTAMQVDVSPQNEKYVNPLQSIMAAVDHIVDMVEAFRDYAHVGRTTDNFSEVNLATVIEHILLLHRNEIRESGAVFHIDPLPTIIGDSVGLGQLLQNLITNALKYSETKPYIEIKAKKNGFKWQISVSDNGIGIEDTEFDQETLFEPFVRKHSRSQYPGSGIGLATCRKIVEQHGGEIWFTSAPNEGTSFYFTLDQNLEIARPLIDDHIVENLALLDRHYLQNEIIDDSFKIAGWSSSTDKPMSSSLRISKGADSPSTRYH